MQPYVNEVLAVLYLPTQVRQEVAAELEERISALSPAERADCAGALGAPLEVAADYNARYRRANANRSRQMNVAIAALTVLVLLFGFLTIRPFYNYAKERVQFMQYSLLYNQMSGIGSAPQGDSRDGPPQRGSDAKGPGGLQKPEARFAVRIPWLSVAVNGFNMVLCFAVMQYCLHCKRKWRVQAGYLPITKQRGGRAPA